MIIILTQLLFSLLWWHFVHFCVFWGSESFWTHKMTQMQHMNTQIPDEIRTLPPLLYSSQDSNPFRCCVCHGLKPNTFPNAQSRVTHPLEGILTQLLFSLLWWHFVHFCVFWGSESFWTHKMTQMQHMNTQIPDEIRTLLKIRTPHLPVSSSLLFFGIRTHRNPPKPTVPCLSYLGN